MTDPRNATNSTQTNDPFATGTSVGERKGGATGASTSGQQSQSGQVADKAKQEAGQVADTAKQQASQVKDSAAQQAADLKDHAADQAKDVKDAAVDATQQVAGTAKAEATQIVGEARDQIQGLVETTMGEVRSRARDGQVALTGTLTGLSGELTSISRGEVTGGPVNQFVTELATRGEGLTTWLQTHEPEDVVVEVRRFAARRPFAFLALSAGAGLLAGRLARGTREVAKDEAERQQRLAARQQYGTQQYATQPAYRGQVQGERVYGEQTYREQSTTGMPTYRATDTQGGPSYRNVDAQGGYGQRGDRVETYGQQADRVQSYGQPVVTEGYVHTTSETDTRGTQGGAR